MADSNPELPEPVGDSAVEATEVHDVSDTSAQVVENEASVNESAESHENPENGENENSQNDENAENAEIAQNDESSESAENAAENTAESVASAPAETSVSADEPTESAPVESSDPTESSQPATESSAPAESSQLAAESSAPALATESSAPDAPAPAYIDPVDSSDDEDYDPEASISSAPEPPKSLESVLAQFSKPNAPPVPTPASAPIPASTDLSKLLSSIGKPPKPATNSPAQGNSQLVRPVQAQEDGPERNLNRSFTPQEQAAYDQYQKDEEAFNSGNIDMSQFAYGSRMFIGNLPTDRITTRQLFLVYNHYGRIAQIAMKQAYGFVQFFTVEACKRAMEVDSRVPLMGNRIDLQVSKPQIPKKEYQAMMASKRERSISPRGRGRFGDRDHRDRGSSRRDYGDSHGYRERGGRGSGSRDRYGGGDYYDARDRGRGGGGGRDRYSAPDIQIFVLDPMIDPRFVDYVEHGFQDAGLYSRINELGPRDSLQAASRQLAHEGVIGVVTLDHERQSSGLVNIQVFEPDSSGMTRFEQHNNLNLGVAIDLVAEAKHGRLSNRGSASLPPRPGMNIGRQPDHGGVGGHGGYGGYQQQPPPQPMPNSQANLLGTLQNLDPDSLQKVVALLQQQGQPQQAQQLGGGPGVPGAPGAPGAGYGAPGYGSQYPTGAQGYGMSQSVQPGQQPSQQVQNIMDQLTRLQGNR